MKKITLFCCAILTTIVMQAQIIHVPGDYPTIQQGINAADPGDTILVADGIYYEQINFKGKKPLVVASAFLIDSDSSHITKTIIDGSQLTNMDSASVVYFVSGEDTTSILCGFTIRNGKGTYTPDNWDDRQGGGIWIAGAGSKIIHNRITHNTLDDTQPGNGKSTAGGGIGGKWEDADYWVIIENNIIDSNICISEEDYALGGGLCISYNTRIANNVISHNTCSGLQTTNAVGGGIDFEQDSSWTSPVVVVMQNSIVHNITQSQEGQANSAGMIISNGEILFTKNEISNNTVISGNETGGGGGMLLLQPDPGCVVSNNIFRENVSNYFTGGLYLENTEILDNTVLVENNYFFENTGVRGGAIAALNIPVILQNNVFTANHAEYRGGGLYLVNSLEMPVEHMAVLINNSFFDNSAGAWGGAINSYLSKPLIFNSIFFYNNVSGNFQEIHLYLPEDTVEIAFSDIDFNLIEGNVIDGGYNINEDPWFMDPESLIPYNWSPCVDAGASGYTCNHGLYFDAPAYQINGYPRPVGTGYDMGAYDLEAWGMNIGRITSYELRITNYPNPVIESTTFSYSLKEASQVTIQTFNSFGQLVAEPLNATQIKGDHNVQWNAGNLPAGMYYYRIQAGMMVGSGKLIKH